MGRGIGGGGGGGGVWGGARGGGGRVQVNSSSKRSDPQRPKRLSTTARLNNNVKEVGTPPVRSNLIIITDNFYIALFSGVKHKLSAPLCTSLTCSFNS